MSFVDLRTFIDYLERKGELLRIKVPVDPNQEINIIQHRVTSNEGPALLFENVKNSTYRIISNLFGTKKRVNLVFNGSPYKLGNKLANLLKLVSTPSIKSILTHRGDILRLAKTRIRNVKYGPVMENIFNEPDLESIPVLTCWPGDGGPFFTLPLVYTTDPETGKGNLGIYRLQRFDSRSTGMHWQIEKGGGFHFHKAIEKGQILPVSVILGGPPSLIMAAIAPLPEGIDERLLAAYIMGRPLNVLPGNHNFHRVPAMAEFIIEGTVSPGDSRKEGPFGDHFGHYSLASNYPVFRVNRMMARKDAIYPATVVGKPIQEDFYIGEALQELSIPIIKVIKPAVTDLWAYPETGFHPLVVVSVHERYPMEALKHTLGILGEGQLSLTKVIITVDNGVNVRDIYDVSKALWRHLNLEKGLHLLSPTAQDTLDFTGPKINTGSRLILLATDNGKPSLRGKEPCLIISPREIHKSILDLCAFGPAFLIVKVSNNLFCFETIRYLLAKHSVASKYLFHILVSDDVDLDDRVMTLWGWFTRFDPMNDLYPADRFIRDNRLILKFPILIDARWKQGYPKPVEFDNSIEKKVMARWKTFGF